MKKSLIVAIALLLSLAGLHAQSTDGQAQSSEQLATKKDLRRATAKFEKTTANMLLEARKVAEEQARIDRQAQARKDSALIDQTNKRLEAIAQANASQQKRSDELFYGTVKGGGVLVTLIAVGLVFWVARSKRKTVEGFTHHTREPKLSVLRDPNIEDLRRFSSENGNLKLVTFTRTLQIEGVDAVCVAELRTGKRTLIVRVNDTKTFIRWGEWEEVAQLALGKEPKLKLVAS